MRIPTSIKLQKAARTLQLEYAPDERYSLSAEFLRVHSPSAEVQGHGRPILQHGKQNVALVGVEPSGNYALKLTFDDGHDSGLYTWDYLHQLAQRQSDLWQQYLEALAAAGKSRDPDESVIRLLS